MDIIVIIFLVRGGYIGLERGLSIELFKIAAAIGACVVSIRYYSMLGEWLTSYSFLSLQVAKFLTFLAIFFALLYVFKVVRVLLFRIMHLELLPGWEKWGGLVLGLARSVVFASLFLFGLTLLPVDYFKTSVEQRSFFGPYLERVAPKVTEFVIKFKPAEGKEKL